MKRTVAIIGAGITGLTLARALADIADVTVFEKARGVGGRMSTRYAEPYFFDHGTQFFTARTPAFQQFLAPLLAQGLVQPWEGKVITFQADGRVADRLWFEPHYVAVPHMNSLCKMLATDLRIMLATEVAPLRSRMDEGWILEDAKQQPLGRFDWVISTAPPAQTERLFAAYLPADAALRQIRLQGCYTLMLGFAEPWDMPWIAAKIQGGPLEWVAVSSSKPGRNPAATSLVVHSSNAWAEAHIDDDMGEATATLLAEFAQRTGINPATAAYSTSHRWRYAVAERTQQESPFLNTDHRLAAVGDWCTQARIEDAWTNAHTLAHRLRPLLYA